jgi:hypothetical protein
MSIVPFQLKEELQQPFQLSPKQIDFYQQNRFIKLKSVLSQPVLDFFNEQISQKVAELSNETVALEERSTYGKAFLQIFNLWKEDEEIK